MDGYDVLEVLFHCEIHTPWVRGSGSRYSTVNVYWPLLKKILAIPKTE